jgi:hypothetical protein
MVTPNSMSGLMVRLMKKRSWRRSPTSSPPVSPASTSFGGVTRSHRMPEVEAGPEAADADHELSRSTGSMVDQISRAIATADGASFDSDPSRYCKLALAALKPLAWPTEAMVDAAHEAMWFDGFWSITAGAPSTSPNHVGQSSSSRITGIRSWHWHSGRWWMPSARRCLAT